MRRLQPDVFNAKVKPFLRAVDLNPDPDFIDVIYCYLNEMFDNFFYLKFLWLK